MDNLRPIGTVFDLDVIPDFNSTDGWCWRTITYRVKAHTKFMRFRGDKEGDVGEEVEPMKIMKFSAFQRLFPGNQMIWEKGEPIDG